MRVEMVLIEKLKPYEKNPRQNIEAVDMVAMSIKEHGFNQPIVADQNFRICVGHTRFLAAKKLGLKEIPVLKKQMSEKEFIAYNLADNKTSDLSEWDSKLLGELLGELESLDETFLAKTAFDEKEIDALLASDDIDDLIESEEMPDTPPKNAETSHVKMVQLFYDDVTFPKFIEMCQAIQSYMTTDNLTDTVYNSVEKVYDEIK